MAISKAKTATTPLTYRTFRPPHVLSDALHEFQRTLAGRDFRSLIDRFPSNWKTLVMGGLLRDMLLERVLKIEARPADIDLVIWGASSIDEIRRKLGNATLSTNAFGGVKCRLRPNSLVFDLWRVDDHTNMARASKPHTVEQLLRHNLLDVDAILWDPKTDRLHDCGCLQAITAGRIGLESREGISQEAVAPQVAHVLVVAYKTNFPLSDEVRLFVSNASQRCAATDVERIIERKVPHAAGQIEIFWRDILSGGTQECPIPTRPTLPRTIAAKRNSSLLNTRH